MVKERIRACGRRGGGGVVPSRVLPHDLAAGEVLTRLPAKSLMRFKCVSKLWRSTISHPSFCKAHRRARSRAAAGLIMVCPKTSTSSIDDDNDTNIRLVGLAFFYVTLPPGSCWGNRPRPPVIDLIHQFNLVSTLRKEEEEEEGVSYIKDYNGFTNVINGLFCLYNANRVSICNFSTREIMDLPAPPTRPFLELDYYLGFDCTTKEYKLLRVCSVRCREDYSYGNEEGQGEYVYFDSKFDILTLGKDMSWRSLHDAPEIDAWKPSACIDGRLYWWHPAGRKLIHFSFDEEWFDVTSRPPRTRRHVGVVHEFRGDLALVVGFVDQALALWVFELGLGQIIEDDGETRDVKVYAWCLHHIQVPYALANRGFKFLANLPTGEVLLTGVEEEEEEDGNSNSNSPIPVPIYSYDHTSGKSEKFITGKNSPSSSRKHTNNLRAYYYEEDISPLDHLITNK